MLCALGRPPAATSQKALETCRLFPTSKSASAEHGAVSGTTPRLSPEEIGLIPQDAPEELVRYFNWVAWTRDLEYDYTVVRADAISVYVFRDL